MHTKKLNNRDTGCLFRLTSVPEKGFLAHASASTNIVSVDRLELSHALSEKLVYLSTCSTAKQRHTITEKHTALPLLFFQRKEKKTNKPAPENMQATYFSSLACRPFKGQM